MLRQIDEPRTINVFRFVLRNEFVEIDCLICNIRWALLVWFYAKGVAALYHVRWTKTEAQDLIFGSLSWAFPITFSIDQLFIRVASFDYVEARLYADSIMVN